MSKAVQRGKAHERRTARDTGGVLVPYSGAGKVKGDVHWIDGIGNRRVFIQCKSSARKSIKGVKTISIKKSDIVQMIKEQDKEGFTYHAMVIHFNDDQHDFALMTMQQFKELINKNE